MAAKIAMMAMTTNNSIKVKAALLAAEMLAAAGELRHLRWSGLSNDIKARCIIIGTEVRKCDRTTPKGASTQQYPFVCDRGQGDVRAGPEMIGCALGGTDEGQLNLAIGQGSDGGEMRRSRRLREHGQHGIGTEDAAGNAIADCDGICSGIG